jgi:hypothetical protein
MKTSKTFIFPVLLAGGLVLFGCGKSAPTGSNPTGEKQTAQANYGKTPGPLPENGFKAQITLLDPPAKLRTGQKQTIQVKVKNASDVLWYARGAVANTAPSNMFYLAVADRWFEADGEKLVTDMDGRYGLSRDLKPGEETEVPLLITAPKDPGDYILELDLVQEQVAWFHDKGSGTARVKIKVER